MLAQNFKTAADLGLDDDELRALVKTLGMLERGELRHILTAYDNLLPELDPRKRTLGQFNMNWWGNYNECGTVCCIGGTAEILMGRTFKGATDELHSLFYPKEPVNSCDWSGVTPAQAAVALRNYLTTGEPNWAEAIAVDAS